MTPDNLPPPDRSRYVQPKQRKNPVPTILVLVVVSVLLFLARNWSALSSNYQASTQDVGSQTSSQAADEPAIAELQAGVTTKEDGDDTILEVTNNDAFTWDHVIVAANEIGYDGREHRGYTDNLAPGNSVTFKASQLNIQGGIANVDVYTIKPDGTITGKWEGMLSSR
jgi:hypothetical protein